MWAFKKQNSQWFGMIDGGDWEYIGTETRYPKADPVNLGLYQPPANLGSLMYTASEWTSAVGHWANVIVPTATAESECRFDRINTYDNVNFTFGFLQLAAHTAGDNLALLIRKFLADAKLAAWFPDLVMSKGKIHQKLPNGTLADLETPPSGTWKSKKLMTYLNADTKVIDEAEKTNALKFMHLARTSAKARQLQVEASVDACRTKLGYWPDALQSRVPDTVLSLVVSHLHWRGGTDKKKLFDLQLKPKPEQAILDFIKGLDKNRASSLESGLKAAKKAGWLGTKTYVKATKKFE